MTENNTSTSPLADAIAAHRQVALAKFTLDQGPTVSWADVGRAFGWIVAYYEHPDFSGSLSVALTRGDYEIHVDPDRSAWVETPRSRETVHGGDEAVLALLQFLH